MALSTLSSGQTALLQPLRRCLDMGGLAAVSQLHLGSRILAVKPMKSPGQVRSSSEVVDFLRHGSSYPEAPRAVETIETHISWVFLADRYAYKLKKPVCFEFVDFSTPELRRRACVEEQRLNRRLAPDVYLSVLPITRDQAGLLAIDGVGRPVDWVVKMRRLSADKALDHMLRRGRFAPEDVPYLAQRLADFYAHLPSAAISPQAYRASLRRHITANSDALMAGLAASDRVCARRAASAQLRYLALEEELFDERVIAGRIVEGHGDLRPEHIYVQRPPVIIDCIEFSKELRTVDVADELSFLALECRRLGYSGVGEQVIVTYQHVCQDQFPRPLLAFYQSYRACVRAKVCVLRAAQEPNDQRRVTDELVRQYLDLANDFASQLGPSFMFIVCGLMGSGKSTLARCIAESIEAKLLSTDGVRHSWFGASETPAAYGEGHYQWNRRRRVYEELFTRAADALEKGRTVVLDGAFLSRALRRQATEIAARHGGTPLFVHCQCPRQTALSRIEERAHEARDISEARTELYDQQARECEPLEANEPAVTVDTTAELPNQWRRVREEIWRRSAERSPAEP